MTALTDARTTLVAAYTDADLIAYGYTPAALVPPAVIVGYGSPWLEPNRVGAFSAKVAYTVTAVVAVLDAATSIAALEDLVAAIIAATPPGFLITSVDSPRNDGTASQGATLEADVNLTAQVKEG
jgi:hypothetical protein